MKIKIQKLNDFQLKILKAYENGASLFINRQKISNASRNEHYKKIVEFVKQRKCTFQPYKQDKNESNN